MPLLKGGGTVLLPGCGDKTYFEVEALVIDRRGHGLQHGLATRVVYRLSGKHLLGRGIAGLGLSGPAQPIGKLLAGCHFIAITIKAALQGPVPI